MLILKKKPNYIVFRSVYRTFADVSHIPNY